MSVFSSFRGGLLLLAILAPLPGAERVHRLTSPRQAGETLVRVFTPDGPPPPGGFRTLYVLPVEANEEARWGDAAAEIRRLDLPNRLGVVVAAPTFSALPWYADHPADPALAQESYFLIDVLGAVEHEHPVRRDRDGRLLVGFSKSGWGAWSLLLRHPDKFARAGAWDAPLMQAAPDRFGMEPIFGTVRNFRRYELSRLVRDRADLLREERRLALAGYWDSFREPHIAMHALLDELGIPHDYRDGPKRAHHWESGWLAELAEIVVGAP